MEQQFLDLLVGGLAVVASLGDHDVGGQDLVLDHGEPLLHRLGDGHGIWRPARLAMAMVTAGVGDHAALAVPASWSRRGPSSGLASRTTVATSLT